jgi:hypothetical protein
VWRNQKPIINAIFHCSDPDLKPKCPVRSPLTWWPGRGLNTDLVVVMFNTVQPLPIVSETSTKNERWMQETYLFWIIWGELYKNCTTGRFFFQVTNYQGFQNSQVDLYEFFLLGMQVQTKIWIITKFWINRVLLYYTEVVPCLRKWHIEPKHFECDVLEAHKLSLNKQRMFPEIF